MATGHQLASITNSCIKVPVNPNTGLASTLDERKLSDFEDAWNRKGVNSTDFDSEGDFEKYNNGQLLKSAPLITESTGLGDLSDDEFYNRLLQLKAEHQKTLKICESIYNEKVGSTTTQLTADDLYVKDHDINEQQPVNGQSDVFNNSLEVIKNKDSVKDMSPSIKRPPSGKPPISTNKSVKSVLKNYEAFPVDVQNAWTNEDDFWKPKSATSSFVDMDVKMSLDNRYRSHDDLNASKMSAASKIEDMWDNFSIEDYAPRRINRTSSMSRLSTSPKKDLVEEWRHRITVPKPFKLSENKTSEKKSKALGEYEKEKEEKARAEEYECQKQFKARPVPAHVYVPLFDEIMEKQEAQRRMNKETMEMLLKSQEKPFNFMRREEEKKKSQYLRKGASCKCDPDDYTKKKKVFKANPFPEKIFDDAVEDQMMEEEEYRRIRMQIRAEELMREASLPPNMKSRGEDYYKGKYKKKPVTDKPPKSGFNFKPKINKNIPDFDEMHRQFHSDLNNRKNTKEATVCKPFTLRTSTTVKRDHKFEDSNDSTLLKSSLMNKPQSFTSSITKSMTTSMDSIPTKMTNTAHLRASQTKSKLQKQKDNEQAEAESRKRRQQRERALAKQVNARTAVNDTAYLRASHAEKLMEFRQAEKERQEEYRKHLQEIEERIGQRPLLFERTAQLNAQKTADKKYLETLQRAGLDADFINKKSSMADSASVTYDRDLSDDDEKSYSYDYSSPTHTRTHTGNGHESAGEHTDEDISALED